MTVYLQKLLRPLFQAISTVQIPAQLMQGKRWRTIRPKGSQSTFNRSAFGDKQIEDMTFHCAILPNGCETHDAFSLVGHGEGRIVSFRLRQNQPRSAMADAQSNVPRGTMREN